MKTVLIVDDDLVSRALARHVVSAMDCHMLEASNGLEAFKICKENEIDIILSDQEMPEMKGLELRESLGENFTGKFVLLTGFAEQSELEIKPGSIDAYLTKPISARELTETLETFLELEISN